MAGLTILTKQGDFSLNNYPWYVKYGMPILLVVAVTLVKLWLFNYIGYKTPFLLYFAIVILSSRYYGVGSAVLTSALSAMACDYYFFEPSGRFSLSYENLIQLLVFLIECGLIIGLSSAFTRAISVIEQHDKRFRAMVEKSSEGIASIDTDGRHIYCSPSVERITGYTTDEFLAFNEWALADPAELSELREQFFRLASHPGKTIKLTYRIRHENGHWVWIENRLTNLLDEPAVKAIVSNFSDITERVNREKNREDFVSIASHELKTPLTSLKAYTQVLESRFKEHSDTTTYHLVAKIEHHVNRVINMVTDLLDVTIIQEGNLNLRYSPFNFNTLIAEIAEILQATTTRHQIKMDLHTGITISADRGRVSQVITNLISNAIKYSPNANEVLVSSRTEGSQVIFTVADQGIGIPKNSIDKIFDRFYRVEGAKTSFQGLGLGLFICMQIIEQHGGTIGVNSEENKGSEFWFSLPIEQNDQVIGELPANT
jgi:PAS domain S-box-containing protein